MRPMQEFTVTSEVELANVVEQLLQTVTQQSREGAAVVALHGELGAGKTTFVQTLAAKLGVAEPITSPTFLLMRRYTANSDVSDFTHLVHVDAYRIESPAELEVLDFAAVLQEPGTIVCMEWAERVQEILPPHTLHLTLQIAPDGVTRHIQLR